MTEKDNGWVKSESGVSAIEYGLMAALMAVVIFSAVLLAGNSLAADFKAEPVTAQVAIIEMVFVDKDGTRDADAYVGPEGSSVDDCNKIKGEFVANWMRDHPNAALVEAFCVSRPDPAALLKYHQDSGALPQSMPVAPAKHIPGKDEA